MEKSISEIIKQRLIDKKKRFWANDNISDCIHNEAEKTQLIADAAEAFEVFLDKLVIDRQNDPNSKETAKRVAKMYINEIMSGRYETAPDVTSFPNDSNPYAGMLVVRSEIKSVCSHHHQPVTGVAYIGIISAKNLLGLSKFSRIAQWHARRGTLQEDLSNQIAISIQQATGSADIGVHIGAEHGCCTNRGIMATSSLTQTTSLMGVFKTDPGTKKEFMDNVALQRSVANTARY